MITMSETAISSSEESCFEANYNAKDLILYALSIGIEPTTSLSSSASTNTSQDFDDLRFLYEHHPQFTSFPTFCLALTFWAEETKLNNRNGSASIPSTSGIPLFPPPLMRKEEVIPRRYLVNSDLDLSSYKLIHSWQSINWHQQIPVPLSKTKQPNNNNKNFDNYVSAKLNTDVLSVVPKSIGTFLTSQTKVMVQENAEGEYSQLCTMQSTALVLGLSKSEVLPFDSNIQRHNTISSTSVEDIMDEDPIFEFVYPTISTQALLYRLASGDSNHIHVDTSVAEQLQTDKQAPLLHGLFTLAVGCRAVMKLIDPNIDIIESLEGKFSQPAFVGDVLRVKVWKDKTSTRTSTKTFYFVIVNEETETDVLTNGCARFITTLSNDKRRENSLVSKL